MVKLLIVGTLLFTGLAGGFLDGDTMQARHSKLRVSDVQVLKTMFNEDEGKLRLILFFSPT